MRTLNLGILAHVDAGKTSLTERLLFNTGAIDRLGSVDSGSTRTDTLAIERRRGITVKTAVASFRLDDLAVNIIDTPGHPDFIAEVERALRVLDGAVLVVSAVEGVQAQTRVILRVLRRLRVPTLVFVNKTDRVGADPDAVVQQIPDAVAMWHDIREAVADYDDGALAAYVHDRRLPDGTIARLVARAAILPAYRGSAITGDGIDDLTRAISGLLPIAAGDPSGALDATVFAIDRDHAAWTRVHNGALQTRDRVGDERITAIDDGARDEIRAGEIGRVRGLKSVRIGDTLGIGTRTAAVFAPPTLASTVEPLDPHRRTDLHRALAQLADQDPLIDLRMDEHRHELSVTLYGEVQKEVIRDTLAEDYGIDVSFGETVTLLRERPAGVGVAGATLGDPRNRHLATLELTIEPADRLIVDISVPLEHIPLYIYGTVAAFRDAIERYVADAFSAGGPNGWEVADAHVTVTRCGYASPESTAGDFRRLTGELVPAALANAGTIVCEPVQHADVEGPAETLPAVLAALPRLGAVVDRSAVTGPTFSVGAFIGADRLADVERALPRLTHGEGTLDATFADWRPLRP